MVVRLLTRDPRYTPSRVSKSELVVLNVSTPSEAGTNVHQADLPPPLPACKGSPNSFDALRVLTLLMPTSLVSGRALAKRSLTGSRG